MANPSREVEQEESRPRSLSDPATWVERYGDALFRFALLRLRDRHRAEEAVQETFLAALQARDSFAGRSSESTWLFAILKRKIVDLLRKQSRERPLASDQGDDLLDALFEKEGSWKKPPRSWTPDPSVLQEASEFWAVFEQCLGGLSERTGRAFSLRVLDGTAVEEICDVLDVTPNNVGVLLFRARAKLRQCLEVKWFADGSGEET